MLRWSRCLSRGFLFKWPRLKDNSHNSLCCTIQCFTLCAFVREKEESENICNKLFVFSESYCLIRKMCCGCAKQRILHFHFSLFSLSSHSGSSFVTKGELTKKTKETLKKVHCEGVWGMEKWRESESKRSWSRTEIQGS